MGCHCFLQDLPDAGIEPRSPALQADCLPFEPPGKLQIRSDQSLTPGYFLSWKQLPSVSVSLPPSCLPRSSPFPPPYCFMFSIWVFLTKMPLCSVPSQPCVVVGSRVYMLILLGKVTLSGCAHTRCPVLPWTPSSLTPWPGQPGQAFSVSPSLTLCPAGCIHWVSRGHRGACEVGQCFLASLL